MSLVIYLLGDILGKLPGTSVIAGLAWSIIIAIVIKCTGILSDDIADNCVYSMNFALKALLPMLVAGIGINSLKITDLIVMPMEGLTAAMNKTVFPKKAFHEVKVILDCTVVVVGIVLCFVFLGELQGIREGTVLCALLVGKVMKPMQKVLVPTVKRFC